ncbi:hypothetical protein [Nocardia sp. NPDC024068]|uniref:hypothetical protein n=1 Tax=Nocardia sp. NPDC024068 TaxID=3157197 RepID=UPI0033F69D7E
MPDPGSAEAHEFTRRTVALLHTEHDPSVFESLVRYHGLRVAHTIRTDTRAVLAALIAVQYALEYAADAVAVPHLGMLEPDTPWWVVTEVADLITATQVYRWGSATTGRRP